MVEALLRHRLVRRFRESVLLKSGIWYLIAISGQRGVGFLAVFLFIRLLTAAEYGTTSVALSWVEIFASTITLNVYAAVSRGKYDFPEDAFPGFLSSITLLGVLSSLIVLVTVWLLPDPIVSAIFGLSKGFSLASLTITVSEVSVSTLMTAWQVQYRYRRYALISLLIAAAKIVLSIVLILVSLPLLQGDRALARMVGVSIISLLAGTLLLAGMVARGRVLFKWEYWRYALSYSIPLIPHALTGYILAHFDRILIDRFVGDSQAGLYTFAYQIGEIVLMIWTASNYAWVPWFFEQMTKQGYVLIQRRSTQYMLAFTAISGLALVGGPFLVTLVAPAQYQVSRAVVPIIMCGQFFQLAYGFYVNVEFYEKRTGYISLATALSAALNIGLNVLLLPIYGYPAAAWATLVAYIVLFLLHAAVVRFLLRVPRMFDFPLFCILGGVMVALAIVVAWLAH